MKRQSKGKKIIAGFLIEEGLKEELRKLAVRKERSMSQIVRRALRQYIDQQEARHGER